MLVPSDRRLALALGIIGLLLTVIGGMRLGSSIRDAGDEQLKIADTTVSQAIRPALGSPNQAATRRAAVVLISRPTGRLSYVSIRDERGHLLASVGSHDGVFAWLPAAGSRSWRAWFYRTLSIRQVLSVSVDAGGKASVAFGLSWPSVLASTWRTWWFWLSLCGLGLACLLAGALGWRSPVEIQGSGRNDRRRADAIRARMGDTTKDESRRRSWRTRLARARAVLPRANTRAAPAQQLVANSGFGQIGAQPPASAGASSERLQQGPDAAAHEPVPSDALDGSGPTEPASFRQSPVPAPDEPSSAGAETIAPIAARTVPQAFDDTTLDVRFQPIWRGSERALLAGGRLTLVWRSGDGRPVAPAVLARQAERAGRLSAFTGWLAERVTMLQSNWHTLGFATVPLVLPLAAAWRDDAEVWRIWRDGLTGTGLADNDLLLQLDASIADQASGLPVRRMLTFADADAVARSDADMIFLPSDHERCGDRARELLAASPQSILLGPLATPESQAPLLARQARVAWFSAADDDAHLYTPRAFARLVSRHALSPL